MDNIARPNLVAKPRQAGNNAYRERDCRSLTSATHFCCGKAAELRLLEIRNRWGRKFAAAAWWCARCRRAKRVKI